MDVKAQQVIAQSKAGPVLCPRDAKVLFPKYTHLTKRAAELAELVVPTTIRV